MKRLAIGVLILLTLLTGLTGFLTGTGSGLAFSLSQLKKWAPAGLQIDTADGRLTGPLKISGFSWRTDNFLIAIDDLTLQWRPSLLFRRTLKVDLLRVTGLRYESFGATDRPPTEDSSEFVLPERLPLPLSIDLENIRINDISLAFNNDATPKNGNVDNADTDHVDTDHVDTDNVDTDHVDTDNVDTDHVDTDNVDTDNAGAENEVAVTVEPVNIESVQFKLKYSYPDNHLSTALLSVKSELLSAGLDLTATTAGQYPFAGSLAWHLRLPDFTHIKGAATISGDTETIHFEPVVQAPYSLKALLTVAEPMGNLSFDGTINAAIDDASAIKAEYPPLAINGKLDIRGTPADLQAASTINVQGIIPENIKTSMEARFQEQLLTLENALLTVDGQPLTISSNGTVDLSKPSAIIDLIVNWTDAGWPLSGEEQLITSPSGTAKVKGSAENLALQLKSSLGEQGKMSALASLSGEELAAELVWKDLQWPMTGRATGNEISQANGSLNVTGQIDDYLFDLRGDAETTKLSDLKLTAKGRGNQQHIQLQQFIANVLEGSIQGNGEVFWHPALSFKVAMTGTQINPVYIAEQMSGQLDLQLLAAGEQKDNAVAAHVNGLSVNGVLRDLPVALAARGGGQFGGSEGLRLALDELSLRSGPSRFSASGKVADALDISWSLDSPDLSTLWPNASGAIQGQGLIYGKQHTPAIKMHVDAGTIQFEEMSLASLKLRADLESSPQGNVEVNLNLLDAQIPGITVSTFSLSGDGRLDKHQIDISGKSDQGNIDAALVGSLADQTWAWDLREAALSYPGLAPWTLRENAKGSVSSTALNIERTCLVSGEADFCADAMNTAQRLQAKYQLTNLALSYFQPLLPEGVQIAGQLASTGELTQVKSAELTQVKDVDPTAQIQLTVSDGSVNVDGPDGNSVRVLNLQPARLNGNLTAAGVQMDALLDLGKQGRIDSKLLVSGALENLHQGDLSGYIKGSVNDLSFVQELVADLDKVEGAITSDLRFLGSVDQPMIVGALSLQNGAAKLNGPGISLTDVMVGLSGKGDSKLAVKTSARSAGGSLNMDGSINLASASSAFNAQITGEDFEVVNTDEVLAAISPDLKVSYGENALRINGEVNLPLLHITPKELPSGAVQVSDDQTFVSSDADEAVELPMDIFASVRVIMGDDILIDAFGLETGLAGELTISELPGKETTASGQLDTVGGTFKAYGQNLKIRKGRIIYVGGPVDSPGFDIEAVRDITSELLVGVQARGSMNNPRFNLFSEPSLPESEQMSYLVFGRPLEDSSPGEQSAARQAAMALGVAGGTLLTEKFGDKLGLDEVKIDSELRESGEQAALVVGKYLSPKLFVSYGVGLFEPISTLQLKYSINRNLKLVTETTEAKSGGDLIYTFESEE